MTDEKPLIPSGGSFGRAQEAAAAIAAAFPAVPRVAVVLGSGLGALAEKLESPALLPFERIPHLPAAGVEGHAGRLVCGTLAGVPLLVQQGRLHVYEGQPMESVILPARALALAGVKVLVATCAAGGIAADLKPGDIVRVTDHVNLMGANPLAGPHHAGFGERFVDLSAAYDAEIGRILDEAALRAGSRLHQGIYIAFSGPTYETPAEIKMAQKLGAAVVGMSLVPEIMAAAQLQVRAAALACVANSASGLSHDGISHREVLDVAGQNAQKMAAILEAALPQLAAIAGS